MDIALAYLVTLNVILRFVARFDRKLLIGIDDWLALAILRTVLSNFADSLSERGQSFINMCYLII